jgi:outer membrane murein-binding lipoprotein Lpp
VIDFMRRIFIAVIAGGFLLLSGVAASAKPDSGNGQQRQNGQQQTQSQSDQKATQPATKLATRPAAKPATKPAATTACGEQGDYTGDHQHEDAAACNDQN